MLTISSWYCPHVLTFFSSVYSVSSAGHVLLSVRSESGGVRSLFRSPNLTLSLFRPKALYFPLRTTGAKGPHRPKVRVLSIDGLKHSLRASFN
jgi:hypothetical protein